MFILASFPVFVSDAGKVICRIQLFAPVISKVNRFMTVLQDHRPDSCLGG